MTYDEMLAKAVEKLGDCRMAGGLVDEDVARQVLEAIGFVPDVVVEDAGASGKKGAKKGD